MTLDEVGTQREPESSNSETQCTVVTYHYVRDMRLTPYPEIKGLRVSQFEQQLDYLCRTYEMITLRDYLQFVEGTKGIPKKSCLLTFDDGFKDHYETVLPRLSARKVGGIFFLITQPLAENKVAKVHQIHFLMASLGQRAFEREFVATLKELFPDFNLMSFTGETIAEATYRYDDQETTRFKKLLNYQIPYNERDKVLETLFEKHFGDEPSFSRSLYLSWGEIGEMYKAGLIFGSHTHTHPVLSRLSKRQQLFELKTSRDIIDARLGSKAFPFSYPYGGEDTFSDNTIASLQRLGYYCAFSVIRGVNQGKPDLYKLKRMDTNDLPLTEEYSN